MGIRNSIGIKPKTIRKIIDTIETGIVNSATKNIIET
jgi:hypothetical protein